MRRYSFLLLLYYASIANGQGYAPDVAARKMTPGEGLSVKLFASEPDIREPIFVKCDERGRLWVIQYLQYPNPAGLKRVKVDRWSRTEYDRVPDPPPHGPKGADRITICEDTNGDGRADTFKDFVSDLNLCTGLEFGHGGVYVLQAPYLLFYPDRDRNDVPDGDPEVLLTGFGMEDAQSLANHLTWGPDGWLYGLNGSTTTCRIRGLEFQQGVWRYHPLTKEFELFCEGGGNLYGLTFDAVGNLIYCSNGGLCYHAVQGGYFEKNFGKHGSLHNAYAYGWFSHVEHQGRTSGPNTGGTIYLAEAFPAPYCGAFLCGDFLGHTCSWWKVAQNGSTLQMKLGGLLLNSHDTWFGATDMCLGPAGEVYSCDFCDKRTAHPDPDADWDKTNGRVYRIEAATPMPPREVEKSPTVGLGQQFDLHTFTSRQLVDLLGHSNHWFRQQARRILAERRDPELHSLLRERSLQHDDSDLALQSLWALDVSGGFDDEIAGKLLQHPSEQVRCWTIRLLGDAKKVSPQISTQLSEIAAKDPSAVVRCQLAATAKRLPGPDGLPIVEALMRRGEDYHDPRIPWLVWWAIESKAISDMPHLLNLFGNKDVWQFQAMRDNIRRLMRRYAAEGTAESYAACLTLLTAAPEKQLPAMHKALAQGLGERATVPRGLGDGGLYKEFAVARSSSEINPSRNYEPITDGLARYITSQWEVHPSSPLWLELALQAEIKPARTHLISIVADPASSVGDVTTALNLLSRFGTVECVPSVLTWANPEQPVEIQRGAITVLGRFDHQQATEHLLKRYSQFSVELRHQIRGILLSRVGSARAALQQVDTGQIDPHEFPLEQLRQVALHRDNDLNILVRKHWGNIQQGTPEEKLATIRRFENDLRAGRGNRTAGKLVFTKTCGSCHELFGEGNHIGPELTKANRGDRDVLLANIVDPSSFIRKEYLTYIVTTNSGQVLTGLLANQDAASVTILDGKNQRTRIDRKDLESLEESPISLMPERLLDTLTPQERRDLFAYLQGGP